MPLEKLQKVKFKNLITSSIAVFAIVMMAIVFDFNIFFTITLLIWMLMVIKAAESIKDNVVMLFFLVAFFVFLLGREFMYDIFSDPRAYAFLDGTNSQTFIITSISLLGVLAGAYVQKKRASKDKDNHALERDIKSYDHYAYAFKIAFYGCYIMSLVAVLYQIAFVKSVGYLASYTSEAGGSNLPSVFSYLQAFMPVALSMYLASCPPRRKVYLPVALYEVYAVLTLLTGKRYPFIGISLFILSYFFLRQRREMGWIKRWYYVAIAIALPILMVFITIYDAIRLGKSVDTSGIADGLKDFFVSQGGSINVIRRTIYNASQIKDMHFVSFSKLYAGIFENSISRALFGTVSYSGNSYAHAMYGHSLEHRLSYIAFGNDYLAGRGVGSSYIAELYHDFSYIGVFVGSFIYGVIIEKINKIEFKAPFLSGLALSFVYYLYLSPRGNFDGFLGGIVNIYALALLICCCFLAQFINRYIFHKEQ